MTSVTDIAMAAVDELDIILFIDANQYLNLYRTATGKALLGTLKAQSESVFVTTQVVEEVQRRKLGAAVTFLAEQFKELKLRNFAVPDHLFGRRDARVKKVRLQLQQIHDTINAANESLLQIAHELLEQISRSEDETSKVLSQVFAHAMQPNSEELRRSRA